MADDEPTPATADTPAEVAVTAPPEATDPAPPDGEPAAPPDAPQRLPQTVEVTDAGPCKKHVKVTIDRAAIDARFDEKFSELVLNSAAPTVPGFRPGKAPRRIVEKRYHREVSAEVRSEVLMASLEQLAEENLLSPLSPPDLNPGAVIIPDSGPLVYEFDIEVRPEFELREYKGLKIRRPNRTFTDADVAAEVARMLEPYGQVVPKPGDPPAVEPGDLIVADLVIRRDGRELNRLPEIRLKVDDRLALADGVAEGFAATMAGAVPGDAREVEITLSQEVGASALRGASVQAEFTVKDVKVVRPPDLTPDVLDTFGVRSADQLEEVARARLDRQLAYTRRQTARRQVLQALAGGADWDLPRDLLARQARKTLARRVMEMKSAGLSDAQIAGRRRVLEQDAVRSTAAALQEHFVLQRVAEAEKIEIDDDELDAEIERIADQTGESPRKVKARLERDDLLDAVATDLLERKALDAIFATAEFEDYDLTPADPAGADASVSAVEAQAVPASAADAPADPDAPADAGG